MSKIYLISDTHFSHNREFIYKPRGFATVEDMNEAIVENWNKTVGKHDTVYHLGDVMLGGADSNGLDYVKRLNGDITIIAGNHDTDKRIDDYWNLDNIIDVVYADKLTYKKCHFYLSHFPSLTANIEAETLHQTTINIFGHTHQKSKFYQDNPYMYCVCADAHNCTPVLIDDIIKDIKNKIVECKKEL